MGAQCGIRPSGADSKTSKPDKMFLMLVWSAPWGNAIGLTGTGLTD